MLMNKKGFTLVELLAVIVVLGLVITITATKGFGAFNNTKKAITEQNKKAIKESINLLEVELENCDDDTEDYDELKNIFGVNSDSCEALISSLKNKTKSIDIDKLRNNEYITGNDLDELNGTVELTFDENGKVKNVDMDSVGLKSEDTTNRYYTFTSNNQGKKKTEAITTIKFTPNKNGKLIFNWKVDSENNYDKLTIKLNDKTLVNGISGNNVSGSIKEDIIKNTNYTLTLSYIKDNSVDKYTDTASITNFNINVKLKDGLNITDGEYKFTHSYVNVIKISGILN